jgi:hypothetical protein
MKENHMTDATTNKIEITPEMIEAGVSALLTRFLSVDELSEYPAIVRTVFVKMWEARVLVISKVLKVAKKTDSFSKYIFRIFQCGWLEFKNQLTLCGNMQAFK